MPLHVKDGGSDKFCGHETLIEGLHSLYLCNKRVRNDLTGLVMTRIRRQHLLLERPVLHYLRRKFHKVTWNGCSAHALVCTLAEKSMKRMTELMEHCLHLIECQK